MNSSPPVGFGTRPGLSLKRRAREDSAASDQYEELRACEENLRRYEARLRAFQAELEAAGAVIRQPWTNSPFSDQGERPIVPQPKDDSSHASWDKVYRARSILEAEQALLKDERLKLKAAVEDLERREQSVSAREARMAEWERQAAAAAEAEAARATRGPWAMARSVFGSHK